MKIKAISLVSGGLDSTLATKVVLEQGIDVVAANFISPFCRCDRRPLPSLGPRESRATCGELSRTKPRDSHRKGCRHEAKFVSEEFGIPLKIVNISEDFLAVLKSPKHGYGSHLNPCIDCRILMLKKAKELMKELDAQFLITGEVVGQRPMSQKINTMHLIEKEADAIGLVLRPLSAKLLEPTIPEKNGWIDRERLLEISGRSRKAQMQIAQDFNIKDYPCPAGGCLLTDPAFSKRVKDLIDHDELTMADIKLLQYGRYFRITDRVKLVVGRNEGDNEAIEASFKEGDAFFEPRENVAGASALARGSAIDKNTFLLAAKIVSRYFDKEDALTTAQVVVKYKGKSEIIEVEPFSEEEVKQYLI